MTRRELDHVIRAAAALTDHKIFVVIGSQAILNGLRDRFEIPQASASKI